jgi:hypothetical protein
MANEVTETRQQKKTVLSVECDPSLKAGLEENLVEAGFGSMTDFVRTLARDFLAGRIQYKRGILQSQG